MTPDILLAIPAAVGFLISLVFTFMIVSQKEKNNFLELIRGLAFGGAILCLLISLVL